MNYYLRFDGSCSLRLQAEISGNGRFLESMGETRRYEGSFSEGRGETLLGILDGVVKRS